MRFLIPLLFLILLACSAFSPTASTGHEGEAKIIGIAYTTAGAPYQNGELFVADPTYTPSVTRSSNLFGQSIRTDSTGRFELALPENKSYILSGKSGTSVLYNHFAIESTTVDMGKVYYTTGRTVTVAQSSDPQVTYQALLVPGTNWVFPLETTGTTTIQLPEEELTVIRRGLKKVDDGSYEQVTDQSIISTDSDSIGNDDPVVDPIEFVLPDSIELWATCTLYISNWQTGDSVKINWGEQDSLSDSSSIISVKATNTYQYSKPGIYDVDITRYRNGQTKDTSAQIEVVDSL